MKTKTLSEESKYYRESLATMKTLHTPSYYRVLAYWFIGIFTIGFIALFFPWQQNIRASGTLTALYPQDRPQVVPSVIAGQIRFWGIREGQHVNQGDVLVVISEVKDKFFDPELLKRTEEMLEAKQGNIIAKEQKINAYKEQIATLRQTLELKTSQAQQKIEQAQAKLESETANAQAALVDSALYLRQLIGADSMFKAGVIPLKKFEEARMKYQSSAAKFREAVNKVEIARNDLEIANTELDAIRADILGKIYKAESELNATEAEYFESLESLAKLRNEYANLSIRNEQYTIRAPRSGYVVQAFKAGLGEMVKEGEPLLSITPEFIRMAVELYVKPMDVPLLDSGREVRLQFDGWPAFQFSGWPSVAMGTFGGRIEVIDRFIDESGKFRVLVVQHQRRKRDGTPDPHDVWPKELRLGSAALGWVLLDDVPIYYEIWRQLNAFPPSLRNKDFRGEQNLKYSDKKEIKMEGQKEMKEQKRGKMKP